MSCVGQDARMVSRAQRACGAACDWSGACCACSTRMWRLRMRRPQAQHVCVCVCARARPRLLRPSVRAHHRHVQAQALCCLAAGLGLRARALRAVPALWVAIWRAGGLGRPGVRSAGALSGRMCCFRRMGA